MTIFTAPRQLCDEGGDSESSPPSSPSLSLCTPLSTSNLFQAADPFAQHGDSFYTPSDHGGLLGSSFSEETDAVLLVNRLSVGRDLTQPTTGAKRSNGSRQFCGCRNPCSNYVFISPTLKTLATDLSNDHQNPSAKGDLLQRTSLKDFSLNTLDLALPKLPIELWQLDLDTPEASESPSSVDLRGVETIEVAEPPQTYRRSDVYDSWMSSWCFRPAMNDRSPCTPLPEILVPSSPRPDFDFLPRSTSSPRVTAPYRKAEAAVNGPARPQLAYLIHSPRMASRNTRVLSGMHKLQNLRDLLVILDQTMATSSLPNSSSVCVGDDRWRNIEWEDTDATWILDSETTAGQAF
ncbi:hypothetical protein NP233_g3169 [Leucocoprinus birnbaumii]|uniref:Uncharacterized protein n=1 Tax=Leucocoprinus birnbaumii TaxID=56174 RepID=A0AAD5W3H1_9AGAR|nr:hypothetical protein NP233_g3169 [Leucocoprinus birnbaumii]